jgi:sterol desaturase/sphingolipid hydroxylase (fatty acid hydroxylase superfamily)
LKGFSIVFHTLLEEYPDMTHMSINHSAEPIRLFKSDFLEFFTHISPVVVVIIWLPFAIYMLAREIAANAKTGNEPWYILAAFLTGLFFWTFIEYLLHRFLFHFEPRNAFQERIIYLFHGVHHEQPQCKTRLVMPPIVSIPLAFVFYGLYSFVFSRLLGLPGWVSPLVSGTTIGYLVYDLTHYATHHFPMRTGILKFLKRNHMMHHYKTPEKRFGVSSPLWDFVFHTYPKEQNKR